MYEFVKRSTPQRRHEASVIVEQPLGRRTLLKASLAVGGGLLVGFHLVSTARASEVMTRATPMPPPDFTGDFEPNAFIRVDPKGAITFIMRNTEVGQGIYTAASMLMAEELEVGLDQITVEAAPPNLKLYTDPLLQEQATGGSASIRGSWKSLREAGAAARMMLVAAAAQRWSVDASTCSASRAVVRHDPSGRTLGYGDLANDAAKQTVPTHVDLKPQSQFTLIGTSPRRLDTPAKVNGTSVFGIDIKLPGMKIGTVAASPVKGGRLVRINESAARAVPGVCDVVRLDDVLAVTGDHMWAAMKGLQAAAPVWDDGPNAHVDSASMIADLDRDSRQEGFVAARVGDADAAIKSAATQHEALYQLPFLAHAPMEPINTTIHVRPDGADVWVGTQVPVRAQMTVAKETGLPEASVNVYNQFMGGAFGRRLDIDSVTQAARIAKHLSYPVKLIWTREEDIRHDLYRPYYYDRISAGLDNQGNVVGWTHRVTGSSVLARWAPAGMQDGGKLDPDTVEGSADTPYEFPAMKVAWVQSEPTALTTLWWRGVGPTHNIFVIESFMDELAAAACQDPIAFRRKLLTKSPRALGVLDLVSRKSGWGGKLGAGRGRGVALQYAFQTYMATVLEVAVDSSGEVQLIKADVAVDCGPVVNPDTLAAQVQGGLIFGLSMALYNEITMTRGRVDQSNFHDYRVMRIDEAPLIDVHIVHNPDGEIGGIGETGTVAAAPVLANAIFAATGRRLRRIPFGTGQLAPS
jgi:isoquinoline 1-oxidoreductase beta subunit